MAKVKSKQSNTNVSWSERTANTFGSLGYSSVMVQWLTVFAVYFAWIYAYFIIPMQPEARPEPKPSQVTGPALEATALSPVTMVLLGILALVMIGMTIYAFIAIPKMVSSAGSKAVKTIASQAAPLALKVQRKPATKKSRLKVSAEIVLLLKALAVGLPLPLAWASHFIDLQVMSAGDALLVAALLAIPSFIFFSVQYTILWSTKTSISKAR